MDLTTLTGTGLISFGGVWILSLVYKKYTEKDLDSEYKWGLAVVVALIWSFIPADLGMVFANHLKDAIGVATGIAGLYQGTSNVAKKIGA